MGEPSCDGLIRVILSALLISKRSEPHRAHKKVEDNIVRAPSTFVTRHQLRCLCFRCRASARAPSTFVSRDSTPAFGCDRLYPTTHKAISIRIHEKNRPCVLGFVAAVIHTYELRYIIRTAERHSYTRFAHSIFIFASSFLLLSRVAIVSEHGARRESHRSNLVYCYTRSG